MFCQNVKCQTPAVKCYHMNVINYTCGYYARTPVRVHTVLYCIETSLHIDLIASQ